jgi:Fic family protein
LVKLPAVPRFVQRSWPADPNAPGGRKERQSFRYEAFVPDPVGRLQLTLPAQIAATVSTAERQVDLLNRDPPAMASLEVLPRRLLRAESVASSRIEGLVLSQRRLAKAEAEGVETRDDTARSVLGNVAAMEEAVKLGARERPLKTRDILEIHRILMEATSTPGIAGKLRDQQNWIGGNAFNPGRADFVPPPPELVQGLMNDLCLFISRTDLSPVLQAAIAHAQFETIHPFADGNGRVGRALIHVVLRRRELAVRYVPPVSLVLAADARRYIAGLTAFREQRIAEWCSLFAEAIQVAAATATELAESLAQLQQSWRTRAGMPRRHSSAEALIKLLPAYPIVTLTTATKLLGRSKQAANEAIAALARAEVLSPTTLARRNRAWEARELFELVNATERELATPNEAAANGRPAPRFPRRKPPNN